ncbi:MAG: hypothetical protein H6R05_1404 [Burkholderiaceae bacterium]|nr:hypothetical protein [Burkholderiaceae bacterium]
MNLNDNKAWKQLVMAVFVVTAIVAFFWFLWSIKGVLLPIFFACFLAYLLNPIVVKLEKWHVQRFIGALIAVFVSVLVLILMTLIPWPIISSQLQILHQKLPEMLNWVHQFIANTPALRALFPETPDIGWVNQLQTLISENVNIGTLGQKVLEYLRQGGSVVLSLISWVLMLPILTYFILSNWPNTVKHWRSLLPKRWRLHTWHVMREIDGALSQYMRGLVLLMLCLAVYYAVALRLTGLQVGISVGILTGLFVIIPYLGFGIGLLLAVLAGFLQFGLTAPFFAVLAVYAVGQLLESYVLTPRLVGERIGLSPVAVIVALLVFGTLFGFVGMLFALPASAALVVVSRFVKQAYFDSAFYQKEAK